MVLGIGLIYFYGLDVNERLSFSRQEQRGVEFIRAVNIFWENIFYLHDSLITSEKARAEFIASTEEAYTQMKLHVDSFYQIRSPNKGSEVLRRLREQLTMLENESSLDKRKKRDEKNHAAIIDEMINLLQEVYIKSNLVLDPDVDSYYMGQLSMRDTPQEIRGMFNNMQKLRELYEANLPVGQLITKPNDLNYLSNNDTIPSVLLTIKNYGKNLSAVPTRYIQRLLENVQRLKVARSAYFTVLKRIETSPVKEDISVIENAYFGLRKETFAAWRSQLDILFVLLEDRVHQDKKAFISMLSLCFLAYVLSWKITSVAMRRVKRPIAILNGMMSKFAMGDVRDDVPFQENSDEIGEMARSVEAFRKSVLKLQHVSRDNFMHKRLLSIMDNVIDALIIIDKNGIIDSVNKGFSNMFGYMAEEVIGKNINILMPEPFHSMHDGYLKNYLTTGEARIIGIGREVLGRRKNSTIFPIDLAVTRIDTGGELYFSGIARDLTMRNKLIKEEKNTLMASETFMYQRLLSIIDSVNDSILVIDVNGKIESVNRGFVKMFGYTEVEALGKNVDILMPEPDRSAHNGYLKNYLDTREPKIIGIGREVMAIKKDGTFFKVDLSVSEIIIGDTLYYSGVIRDITIRKKYEEGVAIAAQQKMLYEESKSLAMMSGMMAHEINNALIPMVGLTEIVKEGVPENATAARDALALIEDSVIITSKILESVLAFGRSRRNDKVEPRPAAACVLESIWVAKRTMPADIKVEERGFDDRPEGGCYIMIERVQMIQVILNIFENAADAMDKRGLITVGYSEKDIRDLSLLPAKLPPGRYVVLEIKDTGPGMDAKTQAQIFEPYFTTKREGEGSGLGMPIIKNIVSQWGGEIEVSSEVGSGTTIIIYIPECAKGAIAEIEDIPA